MGVSSCIDAALRKMPDGVAILLLHGQMLVQEGQLQLAQMVFERALQQEPGNAHAWWLLARLKTQTIANNHIAYIHAAIQGASDSPERVALLARAVSFPVKHTK